jgi:hypothetical protein
LLRGSHIGNSELLLDISHCLSDLVLGGVDALNVFLVLVFDVHHHLVGCLEIRSVLLDVGFEGAL